MNYFRWYLSEAQGVERFDNLNTIHIKQFIVMLKEKRRKPSYVDDLLKALTCLLSYAYEEGYTSELLTNKVKKVKELKVLIRTFYDYMIVRMIEYFNNSDYLSVRNRLMLIIMFDTGMRLSEVTNIFEYN